jgi:hypothetical protein
LAYRIIQPEPAAVVLDRVGADVLAAGVGPGLELVVDAVDVVAVRV